MMKVLLTACNEGGNMLLDIGPLPDGSVPEQARSRIEGIGCWLRGNGEAVYGRLDRVLHLLPTVRTGEWTLNGDTAYFWAWWWFAPQRVIGHFPYTVRSAELLSTGETVQFRQEDTRLVFEGLPRENPESGLGIPVIKLKLNEMPASVS